jgi:hypothetical protein
LLFPLLGSFPWYCCFFLLLFFFFFFFLSPLIQCPVPYALYSPRACSLSYLLTCLLPCLVVSPVWLFPLIGLMACSFVGHFLCTLSPFDLLPLAGCFMLILPAVRNFLMLLCIRCLIVSPHAFSLFVISPLVIFC